MRGLFSLIGAIVALAIWVVGTFIAPAGTGWIHLFLAAGVLLLIRRVVIAGDGE